MIELGQGAVASGVAVAAVLLLLDAQVGHLASVQGSVLPLDHAKQQARGDLRHQGVDSSRRLSKFRHWVS